MSIERMRTLALCWLAAAMAAAAPAQESQRFLASVRCSECHTRLSAPDGAVDEASEWTPGRLRESARPARADIGPGALWLGTMMANAARDPYWKAKVRFEAASTPSAAAEIEVKCLRCHAPMQHEDLAAAGRSMRLDDLAGLGVEGVGCALCHQIQPGNLATRESFSGGFAIGAGRRIFGPHQNLFTSPMWSETGFLPEFGAHLTSSALCATCHTLITRSLDEQGRPGDEFLEQATYLEWLTSLSPSRGESCQSCHMPRLRRVAGPPASQYVAHRPDGAPYGPTQPRAPFGQHFFVGGNVQMLGMLAEIYPQNADALLSTARRTRENLRNAADLRVRPSISGGALTVLVQTVNRTGHKLPTGYPSRRVWVNLSVVDRRGERVFESGAYDPATGDIAGVDFPAEPHRQVIRSQDEVMVYEAEAGDAESAFTVSLIRAARLIKDNRILPEGYDPTRLAAFGLQDFDLNRVGVGVDPDFLPGADQVRYEIDLGDSSGPYRVVTRLYYQAVKPRHLDGMRAERSLEEQDFLSRFPRHRAPTLMVEDVQMVSR